MTHFFLPRQLPPKALALTLMLAFAPVRADGDVVDNTASFGLRVVSGDRADRARFGQYNGLGGTSPNGGLLGFDHFRHTQASGITLQVLGTDLLGETRELSLRAKHQGDWKLSAELNEQVRYDPYTINTGLVGAGSTSPQVRAMAAGTGGDVDLRIRRTSLGLAFGTWLTPEIDVEFSVKTEDRSGARLFGIGMTCPSTIAVTCRGSTGTQAGWATLLLPEPIKANHTQVEARLTYASGALQLTAGYYGSLYNNRHDLLQPGVPGSLNNALGSLLPLSSGLQGILNLPVSLPPDNQAHQFDLAGRYSFGRTTHGTFKLAYSQALQHQDFAGSGLTGAPVGVANLGGRMNTTLVHAGLHARPVPKLALDADLRYEDRADKTPIALYNLVGTSAYTNRNLPNTKLRGKLQGSYQLGSDYRGTLAADYESIDRGVFTASSAVSGISALRQKTDETGVRAELRRTMSETFSGAISLVSTRREGSNWLRPNSGLGVTEVPDPAAPGSGLGPNAVYMPTLANRQRDKILLYADWQPSEALSVQFSAEDGRDKYDAPSQQGLQRTGMAQGSVDLAYTLSDKWRLTGYLSQGTQTLHQARPAGAIMSFRNRNTGAGIGATGKPMSKVELGGSLGYVDDRSVYAQALDATAPPDSVALLTATGGLPDVVVGQTQLTLFGKYAIDKQSTVRVDLVHQQSTLREWSFGYNGVPYAYSDGTTVSQQPHQRVTLLAVSYLYKWR